MGTYFAQDGNWGDAEDIIILDTDEFTDEDWDEIRSANDYLRSGVAVAIAERYQRGEQ